MYVNLQLILSSFGMKVTSTDRVHYFSKLGLFGYISSHIWWSLFDSHWPWLFPHFVMDKSDWALVMLTACCICEAGSYVGWNADPEDCMRVDCIDTRGAVDVESVLELVHCWNFVLSEIRSLNSLAMATTTWKLSLLKRFRGAFCADDMDGVLPFTTGFCLLACWGGEDIRAFNALEDKWFCLREWWVGIYRKKRIQTWTQN